MRKAVFEWVTLLTALVIVGPFVALPLAWLTTASGAADATPLTSTQPALGIGYSLLAMLGALLTGWLGTKTVSRGMGMAAAGFVLVWVAARSGAGAMILRDAPSANAAALRMTIEAALLALPALWLVTLVQRLRPLPDEAERLAEVFGWPEDEPTARNSTSQSIAPDTVYPLTECRCGLLEGLRDCLTSRGIQIVLAAAVGALIGCVFASIGFLKGHGLFAGFMGGLIGGAAGGLMLAGVENPRPALAPYVGVVLVMIAAPMAGSLYYGNALRTVAVSGELFGPARLIPMDWIASMLLGVPWGLSWLASSVKDATQAKHA